MDHITTKEQKDEAAAEAEVDDRKPRLPVLIMIDKCPCSAELGLYLGKSPRTTYYA